MLRRRFSLAKRVETVLHGAERALDEAYASVARLNADLPEVRVEARVAASFGHDVLEHAGTAQALILKARAALLDAHAALDVARQSIGLPAHAFGGGDLKPIPAATQAAIENISPVSDE